MAAGRYAATGRLDDAMRMAEGAFASHADAESQRLLALLHLLRWDFAGAYQAYQRLRQDQD